MLRRNSLRLLSKLSSRATQRSCPTCSKRCAKNGDLTKTATKSTCVLSQLQSLAPSSMHLPTSMRQHSRNSYVWLSDTSLSRMAVILCSVQSRRNCHLNCIVSSFCPTSSPGLPQETWRQTLPILWTYVLGKTVWEGLMSLRALARDVGLVWKVFGKRSLNEHSLNKQRCRRKLPRSC